ncbi:replicative DNA helicase [Pirellula staleyi DSM 6068]|uniref:Replicative DNA helicase n=1 Tax=Pirellula staleyi (strain ATCC 27377 / DSM 6068 / ICPB 4128) TaxID=530564 RepID=D2R6N5_PIRSD|nr:replicative DNA helicase [Pirellula staleyi]ADB17335.1 replicative DNA helicase [Pirellula staleyi DSM 6068]
MAKNRREDGAARRLFEQPAEQVGDRQPPFDRQAEIGLLGSIVLLPDVLDDVVMIVRSEDFYDDAHRKLFSHMCALHEGNKKIDPTLLIDRLKTAGDFEAVGGTAYLSKIINSVPNAAHATYYAEIVRTKSTFRSLIQASTEILRDAYDESQEAKHLLSQAEQKIFSILDVRGDNTVQSLKDVLQKSMDRLEARMSGTLDTSGVEYGFRGLDEKTSGMHNGELIILAARPAMGKTAFAMNIAENVALNQNVPALFVSLEMSSLELADRLLCSVARVEGTRLRAGTLTREDRTKIVNASSKLAQAPLFVDDSPSRTVTEIAAAARRIARREGRLGLIVVDYLQLIEPDNTKDPRQEQVARIARRLKGMAREMKVPVLCLAQLNRQTEAGTDKIPKMSHLRESGAIEQDADVVMFVHREEYYLRGEERDSVSGQAQIIIGKQRSGPAGEDIKLEFLKNFTRFQDPTPDRLEQFDSYNQFPGGEAGGNF